MSIPNSRRNLDIAIERLAKDRDVAVRIRLFSYRGMQEWPPRITAYPDWEMGYAAAAEGLDVLDLDHAIVWGNDLIQKIDSID